MRGFIFVVLGMLVSACAGSSDCDAPSPVCEARECSVVCFADGGTWEHGGWTAISTPCAVCDGETVDVVAVECPAEYPHNGPQTAD